MKKNNHQYFLEELTLIAHTKLEFLIELNSRYSKMSEEEVLDALNELSQDLTAMRTSIKKHLHSKK